MLIAWDVLSINMSDKTVLFSGFADLKVYGYIRYISNGNKFDDFLFASLSVYAYWRMGVDYLVISFDMEVKGKGKGLP